MFKPLATMAKAFGCDVRGIVLIDVHPYRCCVSPASKCIFPTRFYVHKENDDTLTELLPYLTRMYEAKDIHIVVDSLLFGQPPLYTQ